MKKLLLLSAIMLLPALSANAVNWQYVDTGIPNIDVFVDVDTIKAINHNEYYYALKYQVLGQKEKIAYIKANSKEKTLGIIESGDYREDKYRPVAVFDTPHALMKPIKKDTFLFYANDYAASVAQQEVIADEKKNELYDNEVPVSYIVRAQDVLTPSELETFLFKSSKLIESNWNPPKLGYSMRAVVSATVGADGSFRGYKILESSGNDTNDRSIIAALEKTVPYPEYKTDVLGADFLNFQYVFVNDVMKKSVLY